MAKVKEFRGHEVPEGATHYAEENDEYEEGFYRNDGMKWLYCMPNSNIFGGCHSLPSHAIAIPGADEDCPKEDWLKVGGKVVTPNGVTKVLKITDDHGVFTKLGNYSRSELKEYIEEEAFKPEMGKDCEVFIDLEWVVCCFVGRNFNGDYVFYKYEGNNGAGFHPTHSIENFRPLQTEKDKAKEAFIEACFSKSKRAQENNYITNIFEDLFNNGFKAPEDK